MGMPTSVSCVLIPIGGNVIVRDIGNGVVLEGSGVDEPPLPPVPMVPPPVPLVAGVCRTNMLNCCCVGGCVGVGAGAGGGGYVGV